MLTGKTRYRLSQFGQKLILQVEYQYDKDFNYGGSIETERFTAWRDAKITDLDIVNAISNDQD